jgi:hypothetical protein
VGGEATVCHVFDLLDPFYKEYLMKQYHSEEEKGIFEHELAVVRKLKDKSASYEGFLMPVDCIENERVFIYDLGVCDLEELL